MRTDELTEAIATAVLPPLRALIPLLRVNPKTRQAFHRTFSGNGWQSHYAAEPDWPTTAHDFLPALPGEIVDPAAANILSIPECAEYLQQVVTIPKSDHVTQWGACRNVLHPILIAYVDRFGAEVDSAKLTAVARAVAEQLISKQTQVTYSVLLPHLRLDRDIDVDSNIRIVRVSPEKIDGIVSRYRIPHEVRIFDVEAAVELRVNLAPGQPLNGPGDRGVVTTLLTLLSVELNVPLNEVAWIYEANNPLQLFGGGGGLSLAEPSAYQFESAPLSTEGQKFMIDAWKALSANPSVRDHLALARWNSAMQARNLADRVIDLWIALECLFGEGGKSELRYRMSLRIPAFLGKSVDERSALVKTVKQSYDLRSALVHGSQHHDELTASQAELARQTQALARAAIIRLVREGPFDSDKFEERILARLGDSPLD